MSWLTLSGSFSFTLTVELLNPQSLFALVEMVEMKPNELPSQPTFLPQLHLSTGTFALQCCTLWFVGFVVWCASVGLLGWLVTWYYCDFPFVTMLLFKTIQDPTALSLKQSQTLSLLLLLFFFLSLILTHYISDAFACTYQVILKLTLKHLLCIRFARNSLPTATTATDAYSFLCWFVNCCCIPIPTGHR